MKLKILFYLFFGFVLNSFGQQVSLTDSSLSVVIPENEDIPEITLVLNEKFLNAHDELKNKYTESKEITYYLFILVGPQDKYRVDLFKTEVNGTVIGFEGSLWRTHIIKAMHEAKLLVDGSLDYETNYTVPIKVL